MCLCVSLTDGVTVVEGRRSRVRDVTRSRCVSSERARVSEVRIIAAAAAALRKGKKGRGAPVSSFPFSFNIPPSPCSGLLLHQFYSFHIIFGFSPHYVYSFYNSYYYSSM